MDNLFALAIAKFSPERMPALLAEMKEKDLPRVLEGATEEVKLAYQKVIEAATQVENALSAGPQYRLVLVDQDLDDVGYALFASLQGKKRAFQSRQVPLTEEEERLQEDAAILLNTFYPNEDTEIFRHSFFVQWNEVKYRILDLAKQENILSRLKRLGLHLEIKRLERCHTLMGELLGLLPTENKVLDTGMARFEESMQLLIVATINSYQKPGSQTLEDQRWIDIITGTYKRHIEAYRGEQRKKKVARQKPEDTPPLDNSNSTI